MYCFTALLIDLVADDTVQHALLAFLKVVNLDLLSGSTETV